MKFLAFALLLAGPIAAQSAPAFNFVMPHGPGRISMDLAEGWQPQTVSLYDESTRPIILFINKTTGLDLSYILFPNDTAAPTAESCRDAVIGPIVKNLGASAVSNQQSSTRQLPDGRTLAIASYLIAKVGNTTLDQQNVFAFFGDKSTCAEMHLSKVRFAPADQKLFDAELARFPYDPAYTPNSHDYGAMATIFFEQAHNPANAAVYYEVALATLPATGIAAYDAVTMRRVLTDQLSMSYGMLGDVKRSRAVNEAAIARDPGYPLYYYNIACADAESNDPTAARTHLQQAFDRRANTLKGQHLPDPAKDDSILKLKHDKDFWTFVESLPKS